MNLDNPRTYTLLGWTAEQFASTLELPVGEVRELLEQLVASGKIAKITSAGRDVYTSEGVPS